MQSDKPPQYLDPGVQGAQGAQGAPGVQGLPGDDVSRVAQNYRDQC
jgi:hypothetical protein